MAVTHARWAVSSVLTRGGGRQPPRAAGSAALLAMQRSAGNRAVATLAIQRQPAEFRFDAVEIAASEGCDAADGAGAVQRDDAGAVAAGVEGIGDACGVGTVPLHFHLGTRYMPPDANISKPETEAFGRAAARITDGDTGLKIENRRDGTHVSATVPIQPSYQVWDNGRIDIDEHPPTEENWQEAVADLTPNKTGQPRRDTFWSRSITEAHELKHLRDIKDTVDPYVTQSFAAENNGTCSATDNPVPEVKRVLRSLRDGIQAALDQYYEPGKEERAYKDGKPAYQELVAGIKDEFGGR